ncbi:MAG: HEPN domain-containing protein [Candidatus Bathyarchaeia archaeon]
MASTVRRDVWDWLEEAWEEYRTALQLFGAGRYAHACFHFQQGAQKALKALILFHKRLVHRSHDLLELYSEVKDILELEEEVKEALPELSAYYTQARYPNAGLRRPSLEIGKVQAERALKIAEGVLNAVSRRVT